jgi:hypothetical protein
MGDTCVDTPMRVSPTCRRRFDLGLWRVEVDVGDRTYVDQRMDVLSRHTYGDQWIEEVWDVRTERDR